MTPFWGMQFKMYDNIPESGLRRLERRRRKRRRIIIKRLFLFVVIIAVAVLLVFAAFNAVKFITASGGKSGLAGLKSAKKELKLKTLTVPDYVDVQLIPIGQARRGNKLDSVDDIVIHYTGNPGTTAQNNRDYFAKDDTEVCSHFVIGSDGSIVQCVPIDEKSAASNERNRNTISIEVCHEDKSGKFTDSAYESLVKLTAWLCDNAGIDSSHIIRHYDVTGKECPLYFVKRPDKWDAFKADVKKRMGS